MVFSMSSRKEPRRKGALLFVDMVALSREKMKGEERNKGGWDRTENDR